MLNHFESSCIECLNDEEMDDDKVKTVLPTTHKTREWRLTLILGIGTIREDVTTDVLGCIGSWQWLVTFVSTVLMIPSLFNQYHDIFLVEPTEAICIPQAEYVSIKTNSCYIVSEYNSSEYIKCNKWHVQLLWFIWFKKSWQIFCEQDINLLTMAIISRFGLVFGYVMFGFIGDSVGRKLAIMIGLLSSIALGFVITFCDSEAWFRLIIFIKSAFESANLYLAFLIVCEISSNKWRSTLCTITSIPRLLAIVCVLPIADSVPNQETYSFIACWFGLACFVSVRWCPESPQWLMFNRQIPKAEKIVKHAAKTNGITLCSDFKIRPVNQRAYFTLEEPCTCIRILTTHNIRTIVLTTTVFWMLYYFLWSSIFLTIHKEENLSNIILYVVVSTIIFGSLTMIASKKLTMRTLLLINVILIGASTPGFIYFDKGISRRIIASVAISLGVIIHGILLNITPRLFAVNIRATAFGCCHAIGELGTIISYIVYPFYAMNDITYLVVQMCIAVILAIMCLLWPRIDGRELPDVLEDMDYYSDLSKPLRWVTQKTNSASTEEIEMRIYSFGSGSRRLSDVRVPPRRIGCVNLKKHSVFVNLRRILFRKK